MSLILSAILEVEFKILSQVQLKKNVCDKNLKVCHQRCKADILICDPK